MNHAAHVSLGHSENLSELPNKMTIQQLPVPSPPLTKSPPRMWWWWDRRTIVPLLHAAVYCAIAATWFLLFFLQPLNQEAISMVSNRMFSSNCLLWLLYV
jgi:hypothetical protein